MGGISQLSDSAAEANMQWGNGGCDAIRADAKCSFQDISNPYIMKPQHFLDMYILLNYSAGLKGSSQVV